MKKAVLITGCNGGIGVAICKEFLSKNWVVFGVDISNDTRNENLHSDGYQFFEIDITKGAQLNNLASQVIEKFGYLNALVNNAAVQICKPFNEMDEDEWDAIMDVNLKAPFMLVKQFYPQLKLAQGSVVNISSVHAIATSKDIAAYAASKGGLSTLTRALALESAKDGIRVNAVQPGAIDTQMLREGLKRNSTHQTTSEEELLKDLGVKHPISRVGKPNEIAKAVYFLADNEESSFITGQCLTVDGGATIKLSTE